MLINTIILFLQNMLPALVLGTLLLIMIKEISKQWLYLTLTIALLALIILISFSHNISELFPLFDLDFIYAIGYLLIYLTLLLLVFSNPEQFLQQRLIAIICFMLVFSLNNTNFSWYLFNYISQNNPVAPLLLGITLGAGIGFSVSILLYFFLTWAQEHLTRLVPMVFLLFFAVGQLAHGINLLVQIDIWPTTPVLLNASTLFSSQSIFTQLLNVIFGFHTRVTQLTAVVYVIALVLPIILRIKKDER